MISSGLLWWKEKTLSGPIVGALEKKEQLSRVLASRYRSRSGKKKVSLSPFNCIHPEKAKQWAREKKGMNGKHDMYEMRPTNPENLHIFYNFFSTNREPTQPRTHPIFLIAPKWFISPDAILGCEWEFALAHSPASSSSAPEWIIQLLKGMKNKWGMVLVQNVINHHGMAKEEKSFSRSSHYFYLFDVSLIRRKYSCCDIERLFRQWDLSRSKPSCCSFPMPMRVFEGLTVTLDAWENAGLPMVNEVWLEVAELTQLKVIKLFQGARLMSFAKSIHELVECKMDQSFAFFNEVKTWIFHISEKPSITKPKSFSKPKLKLPQSKPTFHSHSPKPS